MYSRVFCEEQRDWAEEPGAKWDGRYVLQRHHDEDGPHLDLRVEGDGHLMGWRIEGTSLEGGPWASTKGPHSTRWLTQDGETVREDAGVYRWLERTAASRALLLRGNKGVRIVRVDRKGGLTPGVACAVRALMEEADVPLEDAPRLVADGLEARRRAVTRLLGLGRELDGEAFDAEVLRRATAGLSLDEIHAHLRAYEVRFDAKYPPVSVSRPETLDSSETVGTTEAALAIAREGL